MGHVAARSPGRIVLHHTATDRGEDLTQAQHWMADRIALQVQQHHVQKIVYTAVLDRQAAGHIGLTRREGRIGHQPPYRAVIVQPNSRVRAVFAPVNRL